MIRDDHISNWRYFKLILTSHNVHKCWIREITSQNDIAHIYSDFRCYGSWGKAVTSCQTYYTYCEMASCFMSKQTKLMKLTFLARILNVDLFLAALRSKWVSCNWYFSHYLTSPHLFPRTMKKPFVTAMTEKDDTVSGKAGKWHSTVYPHKQTKGKWKI